MATVGLTIFVNRVFVIEVSGIVYSTIVGVPWIACLYFEGLVLLFLSVLILLVVDVFPGVFSIVTTLGGSVSRRVVSFLRSGVDNGCISRDVTDIYRLNFLIGVVFNKMTLLSVF